MQSHLNENNMLLGLGLRRIQRDESPSNACSGIVARFRSLFYRIERGQFLRLIFHWTTMVLVSMALVFNVACRPNANLIVFTSDRDGNSELYSISPTDEDSDLRNITNTRVDEFLPKVSPDGRFVAFLSRQTSFAESENVLEVMRINGNDRLKLSGLSGNHRDIHWSPDSKKIAYLLGHGMDSAIWVVNKDGLGSTKLTTIPVDELGGWSPDGDSIVFAVHGGQAKGIYTRNPEGVNRLHLTSKEDSEPAWSPDGSQIAFISKRDGTLELYVMDKNNVKDQRKLTQNDLNESGVSWSPDGKLLLFVGHGELGSDIFVINPQTYGDNPDEKDDGRLTFNDIDDYWPAWSSNGEKIVFVSNLDQDEEIFVMDADGKNQIRLTNNNFQDTYPSW